MLHEEKYSNSFGDIFDIAFKTGVSSDLLISNYNRISNLLPIEDTVEDNTDIEHLNDGKELDYDILFDDSEIDSDID